MASFDVAGLCAMLPVDKVLRVITKLLLLDETLPDLTHFPAPNILPQ